MTAQHDDELNIIRSIVDKHLDPARHRVFLFGSRVSGSARRFSDFDIGIDGEPLRAEQYFELVSDLEESDVPYKMDVVQMKDVSESFRRLASERRVPINY